MLRQSIGRVFQAHLYAADVADINPIASQSKGLAFKRGLSVI